MRSFRVIFVLTTGFALLQTQSAAGQTQPNTTLPTGSKKLRLGDVCLSKTLTGGAGIVKIDLCDRPYCGSTMTDEPFVKRNYDRKRMPCDFKLVDNLCRCVPTAKR